MEQYAWTASAYPNIVYPPFSLYHIEGSKRQTKCDTNGHENHRLQFLKNNIYLE